MEDFDSTTRIHDVNGNVVQLNHMDAPYRPKKKSVLGFDAVTNAEPNSVRAVADEYLQDVMPQFGLKAEMAFALDANPAADNLEEQLVYADQKSVMGNSRVTYNQTLKGIPVWESGIVVQVEESPMQVLGSQSTVKRELQLDAVKSDAKFIATKIDDVAIKKVLGIAIAEKVSIISDVQTFVYRYYMQDRIEVHHDGPTGEAASDIPFVLPAVAAIIREGIAYVVSAVEFSLESKTYGLTSWLTLIEQNTGSVLLLRSLAGCVCHITSASQSTRRDAIAVADAEPFATLNIAGTGRPTVVFFDIGDTLGKPVFSGGQLARIDVFAEAFEVVKELFEKNIRVGIISDPGGISVDLIVSLLQDSGIVAFLDQDLFVWGLKNNQAIFVQAANLAGVPVTNCLFVGENSSERSFAGSAGFQSVESPERAFSIADPAAALAWVYLKDPRTKTGSSGPLPSASGQDLDRYRDLVSLVGLTPVLGTANQTLTGQYISLQNIDDPNPTMPSSPVPGDFRFSVNSNEFGAVNAYHNCDRLFRILEDFGIDVRNYFDGTTFPVNVDHRVRFSENGVLTANTVNARAPGASMPPRSLGFQFALAALNSSVGMASDWRVVLHEFGHALLWDNVGSPNFRFAHSAGDALAAILNDVDNRNERGATFPWVGINRSHLRPVSSWAWYGTRYNPFGSGDGAGYVAEEILSSTLFRLYQAAGGDSSNRNEQKFAAAYVTFLIIKSIGLMSPANNPARPDGYADLLMQADTGTFMYQGEKKEIGVLRKAIRWAFEMQGAYRQPSAAGVTPTNRIGNPPQVDVFVNDGRDGHYSFINTLDSKDIWNRQQNDAGSVHQEPVAGQENFAFVRVSNRGLSQATDVEISAFQSTVSADQIWPTDWLPLIDASLASAVSILPGNSIVVGPFRWTPTSMQPTLLMSVSATGDQSNLSRFTSANPIANRLLVPLDNNLAQRTMTATSHETPIIPTPLV